MSALADVILEATPREVQMVVLGMLMAQKPNRAIVDDVAERYARSLLETMRAER